MAFVDFTNELVGMVPKLPVPLAQKCVNRAWRDIREARLWSWLAAITVFEIPAQIQTGTVSVTQYSATVVGNAAASAAWLGLTNPLITFRQFRVAAGAVYSIIAFDGVSTLTLDRVYEEGTNAAANYQIYRCYYSPPNDDFLRWASVIDPTNGYFITGGKLHLPREWLDMRDPQRTVANAGSQLPYILANYKFGTVGSIQNVPYFELWPHPITSLAYAMIALYQRKGTDMAAPTDDIVSQIPQEVLMERAKYHAYEWGETHKGSDPELAPVNFMNLRREANKEYQLQLMKAQKQDNETYVQNLVLKQIRGLGLAGIIDSNWLQRHASVNG